MGYVRNVFVFLVLLISMCCGRVIYQSRIPNGDRVPYWPGVGHVNAEGGGERNQFGIDFLEAGLEWTEALCQMDSDEDGLTNGEELGDPMCVWKEGDVPQRVVDITHPGVHNDVVSDDNCDGAVDLDDTFHWTWGMDSFEIPAEETNYICDKYDFPRGETIPLYIYGYEYIIDSPLLHHTILYECDEDINNNVYPSTCGDTRGCVMLRGWAPGSNKYCHPEGYARLLLPEKYYIVQYHYNNPLLLSGKNDSSASILKLSEHAPDHIISTFTFGSIHFELPPGELILFKNECPAICTQDLIPEEGLTFTSAFLHAHNRGKTIFFDYLSRDSMNMDERNNISVVEHYLYSNQKDIEINPITVYPGDSFSVNCLFDTTGDTLPVHGGPGTQDEMCLAFMSYYPRVNRSLYCGVITVPGFHDSVPFYACGNNLYDYDTQRKISRCSSEQLKNSVDLLVDIKTTCNDHCDTSCRKFTKTFLENNCIFSHGINTVLENCNTTECNYMSAILSLEPCAKDTEDTDGTDGEIIASIPKVTIVLILLGSGAAVVVFFVVLLKTVKRRRSIDTEVLIVE